MKKVFVVGLALIFCVALVACQRRPSAQAASEEQDYQPRPGPKVDPVTGYKELKGELRKVDMLRKTVSMRVENGMEQTFRFDDDTVLTGVTGGFKVLTNAPGSEMVIQWKEEDDEDIATTVTITELRMKKKKR